MSDLFFRDLGSSLSALFPEEKDQEAAVMWSMVAAHSDLRPSSSSRGKVDAAWRNSTDASAAIVAKSKRFLEKTYKKFVDTSVYSNLQQAQLGGVPSAYNTIRSFVGMKVPTNTPGII